ncbi:MAG: phosphoenolpyruvate carboxykinase (ATP) [Candidatus Latescibacteria bacterium]|nr:phosphoenolpyruvate carboxykinase (ATP) [Candidatus Latescibacterota bacterium]NIM66299.1 phosphoenolpyruvate carboxykinase (ATP) [Candidatus Latescibacterota bacterium]NIO02778.1 phosphoenolpyruvate carboxykinase (ATP) [Candidatus Latescibacterota bacterium]NIO29913.1 phosphoenolpyruvate carboxykinase (ATP) [Candidatus Latescibacterota bacterium]NIO57527.1 phosphoenolpyruvate carboxykinase (ATP) [Candidatus Latescibacterota bacterium]
MSQDIYDESVYNRFYDNLQPFLNGRNIEHAKLKELKERAIRTATPTRFGSFAWRSAVSSRVAPRTVYLGSEPVRLPSVTDLQREIIEKAPEELHNVLHMIRTLPLVHIRRQMGDNNEFNPICNLYISVADPKNIRLAYMWGHTLREPNKRKPGPEFIMFHIPDEHHIRQQVLTIPEYNLNIALGTDYMGEDKKGFLRQAMYSADKQGMLGLHAGTKIVTARDSKDGKLKRYGVLIFGLSATGKSTWSCHQLGLNHRDGEKTEVIQDDIVFLKRDGSALGTEVGFFVKTDVDKTLQEAMYNALVHKSALFENVMVDSKGNPDFLDEVLCANGRAVIQKDELKIRRGRRMVGISAKSIDLPPADELDGLMFAFITRRNTIMPFAQELTPEQGVLAYLWGESTHSYASQPLRAGESVRIVGTDPFIIGSRAKKTNQFHDIVMDLFERYPDKIKFYQYNTGGVGEIIETYPEGGIKKKRQVHKVTRVPINLMAALQRGDFRDTNRYERGRFGTKEIVHVDEFDLSPYDPKNFYSEDQIQQYLKDIVSGRRKFTEQVSAEGLKQEIIEAAERSFQIVKEDGRPAESAQEVHEEPDEWAEPMDYEPRTRLPRDRGWRWR